MNHDARTPDRGFAGLPEKDQASTPLPEGPKTHPPVGGGLEGEGGSRRFAPAGLGEYADPAWWESHGYDPYYANDIASMLLTREQAEAVLVDLDKCHLTDSSDRGCQGCLARNKLRSYVESLPESQTTAPVAPSFEGEREAGGASRNDLTAEEALVLYDALADITDGRELLPVERSAAVKVRAFTSLPELATAQTKEGGQPAVGNDDLLVRCLNASKTALQRPCPDGMLDAEFNIGQALHFVEAALRTAQSLPKAPSPVLYDELREAVAAAISKRRDEFEMTSGIGISPYDYALADEALKVVAAKERGEHE